MCLAKSFQKLVQELKSQQMLLTTVESATCGLIASTFGSISGVSAVYHSGFVVYATDAKTKLLSIAPSLIKQYGTISQQIAEQMLTKAYEITKVNCVISVTGNAGPNAIENKPIGLFYIGIKVNEFQTVYELLLPKKMSRNKARKYVAKFAIQKLINVLKEKF